MINKIKKYEKYGEMDFCYHHYLVEPEDVNLDIEEKLFEDFEIDWSCGNPFIFDYE